jgi:hypothetical protein
MRRILLLPALAALLALPAVAAARSETHAGPGFVVVRDASTDRGVNGNPVATVVVRGFVIGEIAQEGAVQLYNTRGSIAPQVAGVGVQRRTVTWHTDQTTVPGTEFSGSDFRFRAVGGVWRIVVFGSGVSLYAGGEGKVVLHGSVEYPRGDGEYSIDGAPFASLPSGIVKRTLGAK